MASEGAGVSVEGVAIWDLPHTFRRLDDVHVFSYGLLLPELPVGLGSERGKATLGARWGFEELFALISEIDRLEPVSTDEIGDLAAGPGIELGVTSVTSARYLGLGTFAADLHRAADSTERVPEGWEEQMRRLLDKVERPDRFVWRWRRDWTRVRAPRYDSLLERLAIEYDQLVTRRPRLSRCVLCRRVFVPMRQSRPERHCRANLWLVADPPRRIQRCVPLDERERGRVKKRLDQRYRRALARAGNHRDPDVIKAKRDLGEWEKANPPARRGRQPRRLPEVIPINPDEGGGEHAT
jgi:hypothetical protein